MSRAAGGDYGWCGNFLGVPLQRGARAKGIVMVDVGVKMDEALTRAQLEPCRTRATG